MASIKELDKSLPAYYTLSNKNLIIIGHVRDETIYFFDYLGPRTTVILLAEPKCYAIKKLFLELLNEYGSTVIDLREEESFDEKYVMTKKSGDVITRILDEYTFEKVITHPPYSNDPQNKSIYDLVSSFNKKTNKLNHYVYKIDIKNLVEPCAMKKGIIELYSKIASSNKESYEKIYKNYIDITKTISGIVQVKHK